MVVADINEPEALATAESLQQASLQALAHRCDVNNWDDVDQMFRTVTRMLGPVDILINNAGILRSPEVEAITEEEWDLVIDVNLKGAFLVPGWH